MWKSQIGYIPDRIYKSCRLTSYFDGAKARLYADLATRFSDAKGIKKDATCDASYESCYGAGEFRKKIQNLQAIQIKEFNLKRRV